MLTAHTGARGGLPLVRAGRILPWHRGSAERGKRMGANGNETVFTMEATPIKYGRGAAEEVGWEVRRLRMGRVMLVSDPGVVQAGRTGRGVQPTWAEGAAGGGGGEGAGPPRPPGWYRQASRAASSS